MQHQIHTVCPQVLSNYNPQPHLLLRRERVRFKNQLVSSGPNTFLFSICYVNDLIIYSQRYKLHEVKEPLMTELEKKLWYRVDVHTRTRCLSLCRPFQASDNKCRARSNTFQAPRSCTKCRIRIKQEHEWYENSPILDTQRYTIHRPDPGGIY